MEIKNINIKELKYYDKNPRNNDKAVEYVANSIKEFGFKVPIVVDKNNVIVCGHTRYKASKKLKLKEVPCIIADDLTDEQINAFRIADNKVSEKSSWNIKLLQEEMRILPKYDFTNFGFEYKAPGEKENGSQRNKTLDGYNLDYVDFDTKSDWGFPDVIYSNIIPSKLIGFNEVLTSNDYDCGVHFYLDDYQFERIWNNPEKYLEKLSKFQCVIAPDFSLYIDMPKAMQIWNVYRSRTIAKAMSDYGINVIPCIQYSDSTSYDFCFDNLPSCGVVSLSSVGCVKDKQAYYEWQNGALEMIKRLKPRIILLYGTKPLEFNFGDIRIVEYKNIRGGKNERK